jgi:hypothetical protein
VSARPRRPHQRIRENRIEAQLSTSGRVLEPDTHRARNLRPPDCDDITTIAVTDLTTVETRRRKIMGGLIHEYERAA